MASTTNLLIILITIISLLPYSNSQAVPIWNRCSNTDGNYTSNSTFQNNLKVLLNSLSSNASSNGFSDAVGESPNRVYGLILCRGDLNVSECQTCLSQAPQDIQDKCPFQKTATVLYDNCFLRYSNQRLGSNSLVENHDSYLRSVVDVQTDWPRFNQSLVRMLRGLAKYAAHNKSAPPPPLYATGKIDVVHKDFPQIYGIVQCTIDLSPDQCNTCLDLAIQQLPNCCNRSIGGRVNGELCNFRYEVDDFYKGPTRLSLPAIAPSPGPVQSPSNTTTTTNTTTTSTDTTTQGNKKNSTGLILAIAIPLAVALFLIIFCCTYCLKKKKRALKAFERAGGTEELTPTDSLLFDLQTIKNATDNFSESNKLGEGGFGEVYKGKLVDGREIAAKRLSASSAQGLPELRNEVLLLAKLQHRNLVRLLGVCSEVDEKILIYEFVENKSLEKILFDPSKRDQLHWERRYKIISGIVRGMLYLHEESQHRIIHRDLKASNILLDADMNPKISDFGLARLYEGDQTQVSTIRVVGTYGYMSPEYAMRGHFSNKSDVFSLGVLVLEIVTGRKNGDYFVSGNSTDLLGYVWENWTNGTTLEVVDPSFGGQYPQGEVIRCIQIGLLCVQEDPADRPTMSAVNLMLNSYSISVRPPSKPAFVLGYTTVAASNSEGTTDRSGTRSAKYTANEVSITELGPR